ncbi:uncharacterized protein PG998_009250 [Apiospora kogelbergensis]|uniref:uncharacterized protein n=1 Tax=Apiospora kogelbergensis TaxID=1337665 RepID=UPI0031317726
MRFYTRMSVNTTEPTAVDIASGRPRALIRSDKRELRYCCPSPVLNPAPLDLELSEVPTPDTIQEGDSGSVANIRNDWRVRLPQLTDRDFLSPNHHPRGTRVIKGGAVGQ